MCGNGSAVRSEVSGCGASRLSAARSSQAAEPIAVGTGHLLRGSVSQASIAPRTAIGLLCSKRNVGLQSGAGDAATPRPTKRQRVRMFSATPAPLKPTQRP